jgi:phospholipase A-2-activating protein
MATSSPVVKTGRYVSGEVNIYLIYKSPVALIAMTDGECSQTIVHPAISVWAVSTMPNGDIVSGCSDGIVRIFSASEDRWASQAELQEYEAKVASQALPSQVVGDVKKSDLPGLEALKTPGL